MNKNWKIIFGVVVWGFLYLSLRLPGLETKMTFHFDQGIHLLESWQMVADKKIILIGPMITSKVYLDRGFFFGPQYYYFLGFLGLFCQWNPLTITVTLLLIEMVVFFIFSFWIGKKWGGIAGLATAVFLTISPFLIIHSRFIWNPHIALWIGLLITMILVELAKHDSKKWWFILGVLMGVLFGLHFTMGILLIPVGFLIVRKWKKIKYWWWLIPGGITGNLPWFLFELRHNFYNTKTFFWVMANSSTKGKVEDYYLINPFLGLLIVGFAIGIGRIKSRAIKILVAFVFLVTSFLLQNFVYKDTVIPLGMPKGWNYPTQLQVVEKILANGCPTDFNVATTNTGITRAYDLRYLLTIRGCPPMGVEDYPRAKTLFLIAPTDRVPEIESVWEVSSMGKTTVKDKLILNSETIYYELGF